MWRNLIGSLLLTQLLACSSYPGKLPEPDERFQPAQKSEKIEFTPGDLLALEERSSDMVYRLAEGDQLNVQVWGRPEVSGKQLVGPDGRITLPLAGPFSIRGETRESAANRIQQAYQPFYRTAAVTVGVELYTGNRITVLGRVQNPGTLQYERPPTLLEALARAGSLPVIDKQATLTRCAVFRGRDKILWIDLKQLLGYGQLGYNIRLQPNDLVYIPDSFDTLVYVMGAVQKPGAYRLTPDMSLMDALSQAGGPTEDASPEKIALYRPGQKTATTAPFRSLLESDRKVNFALNEGDIIYVPRSGLAEAGYVIRQLLPGLSMLSIGYALSGQ